MISIAINPRRSRQLVVVAVVVAVVFAGWSGLMAWVGRSTAPMLGPVRLAVTGVSREAAQVIVRGTISNDGATPLAIPGDSLRFYDSTGQHYQTDTNTVRLPGRTTTTFEVRVPVPDGRGLTLILDLSYLPPIEVIVREANHR